LQTNTTGYAGGAKKLNVYIEKKRSPMIE